jgi:Ca2+-transporting ATPase
MGSGSDVAKDTAQLVLLDDNYETIVAAIEEGRRIIENIKKTIVYSLLNLSDELILIGGSIIFGLVMPINAFQILWVNFFADSFPAIAFAFENHFKYILQKPQNPSEKLINNKTSSLILLIGFINSSLLIFIYYLLLKAGFNPQTVRTFIFASFGTYSLFSVFSVRNMRQSIFRYNPFSNIYIVAGSVIGFLLMTIAIYTPLGQELLKTSELPGIWLWGVLGIGIINTSLLEIGKYINNRNNLEN